MQKGCAVMNYGTAQLGGCQLKIEHAYLSRNCDGNAFT